MNTQTVFASTLLIVLVLVVMLTWKKFPSAKYIIISRSDGENKYIAISSLEVIDNKGGRREIVGIEGRSQLTDGFSNSAGALAAAAGATTGADIKFNGTNMGYVKDTGVPGSGVPIGPLIGFVPSAAGPSGYLIFSVGCTTKIARLNIRTPEDDTSRNNLQRVKVYLLDKDKHPVKGAEQIIPISSSIPQTIHHISFV